MVPSRSTQPQTIYFLNLTVAYTLLYTIWSSVATLPSRSFSRRIIPCWIFAAAPFAVGHFPDRATGGTMRRSAAQSCWITMNTNGQLHPLSVASRPAQTVRRYSIFLRSHLHVYTMRLGINTFLPASFPRRIVSRWIFSVGNFPVRCIFVRIETALARTMRRSTTLLCSMTTTKTHRAPPQLPPYLLAGVSLTGTRALAW